MNTLIGAFKDCAHQAGEVCSFSNGILIREFGLGGFLDNAVTDLDSSADIAIKAIHFFCDEREDSRRFKIGVLAVDAFLNLFSDCPGDSIPAQALQDLVSMLTKGSSSDAQLRAWIDLHF